MDIKISVIVPIYKVEAYLEECIESIIHQSYNNLEIILVDDGSPDRCPEICNEYALKDSRIVVIHKENGGLSDARNVGIQASSGDYLSFIDSDDWIRLDTYERLIEAVETTKADVICFGTYDVYRNITRDGICPNKSRVISGKEAFLLLLNGSEIGGYACFKLYKRNLFQNIRFPVGELFEDIAIMPDILLNSEIVALMNARFYYYRHREGSILNAAFSQRKIVHLQRAKNMMCLGRNLGREYEEAARHYYANSLLSIVSEIDESTPEMRKQYKESFKKYKSELVPYSKYLEGRNKIKHILIKLHLYRPVKTIYKTIMIQK